MDPLVWGPSYWFFLHNVAFNYPTHPTTIQKKIHYRLIHNFHEFLPSNTMAGLFVKMIDKYPVTPYLDTKKDFIKWMWFIHNKINTRLNKPTITLSEHYQQFHTAYEAKPSRIKRFLKERHMVVYTIILLLIILWGISCKCVFK
jgi:hypothetical protein